MKEMIVFVLICLATIGTKAQLANTKWKGTLHLENPMDVFFNFGTDTLEVVNAGDNSPLETMIYSVKDTVLTIQKVSGMSVCDSDPFKYSFEITGSDMTLHLVTDACDDRAQVLNNMKLSKQ